jgi:hypothetical protein
MRPMPLPHGVWDDDSPAPKLDTSGKLVSGKPISEFDFDAVIATLENKNGDVIAIDTETTGLRRK